MPRTYELAPFLGEPLPVEIVSRLHEVRRDDASLVLTCGTDRYEPLLQDYYGTTVETVFGAPAPGRDATIRLDFWQPGVVRLRYSPAGASAEDPGEMLVGRPDPDVRVELARTADGYLAQTAEVELEIVAEPWRLVLRDRSGRVLWATTPVDLPSFRRPERQWNPAEQRWIFLHRYAYPLGSTVGGRRAAFGSFSLRHDEHIYGFGESFGRLDKAGTFQRMWLQEAFSNASPAAYKQVPWHLSSRGYGMFVHTANATGYHVGDLEHSALSVTVEETDSLDLFLVAGHGPKEILPRYTALTGRPAVPPKWTFGLWMSRISYTSQDEVERVAADLRSHRIPCDVLHIDTGWFARDYTCDLTFSTERFPDPAGMCARLAEQGFRVSLWQWPNYNVTSPLFDEGVAGGHLARRPSGHTFTYAGGYGEDAGLVDFSSPEAVRWYQEKLAALFDLGVAAIKVDYGEGAPPDAVYASVPGAAMHNLYPLLYQKAVWEVAERSRGEAVLWARAGWAGSQRYPIHWSGDGVARFEDLACVLRAALSIGLSGFPFYSHDIGGFSGLPDAELYVRWSQLGLFSSHARAHGVPPREPWAFGERAEGIVRDLLELRYRLLPYLWTEAERCGRTSLPMVRALFVEWPDDPVAHRVDDAYLLGDRLLVAPVLEQGAVSRRVYLPAGHWIDWWTGQRHEGGRWVVADAPLERIPLFLRGGTALPLAPAAQHVGAVPADRLTVVLAAVEEPGDYEIRLSDDSSLRLRWSVADGTVRLRREGAPVRLELVLLGVELGAAPRAVAGETDLAVDRVPAGLAVAVGDFDEVSIRPGH
ncbi:TIM-barrel domain-containing protein [Micromonospora sp. NPDC050980]|uniref:glycoside hydrolase family 31 protein n=1 Tax=Micromonospora sp. NPDC050980 TaxID=3155161 RepID=UPI0033F47539